MAAIAYDDLADVTGADLGYSRWFEIDQPRIDAFAEATEDRQWIHVDPRRAAESQFGSTIAHGFLTLSLIAGVLEDVLRVDGVEMSINYGADRVRFPAPVPSGSRLRGHGEIVQVAEVSAGRQVTVRVTMHAEGADRPACVADVLIRLIPTT